MTGTLDRVDFTGAQLRAFVISNVAILDSVFDSADCRDVTIVSSSFTGCSMRKVNFTDGFLGWYNWSKPRTMFNRVDFSGARFVRVSSSNASFTDCQFHDVVIRKHEFSSSFVSCVFSGSIEDVEFYGIDDRQPGRATNDFIDVDLREATLRFVGFKKIDLAHTRLPAQDHVILRHARCVLPLAIEQLQDTSVPARKGLRGLLGYHQQWLAGDIVVMHRLDAGDDTEQGAQWAEAFLMGLEATCAAEDGRPPLKVATSDLVLERSGPVIGRDVLEARLSALGLVAPSDYLDLVSAHDGLTGVYRGSPLVLFSSHELGELKASRIDDPEWLVHFGSDMSSTFFSFDVRETPASIVACDKIDTDDIRSVGSTVEQLFEWLLSQSESELPDEVMDLAVALDKAGHASPADFETLRPYGLEDLPAGFVQFLLLADGAEGNLGDGYLALWRVRDIQSANRTLETESLAPGLLCIGTDGAAMAYALDFASGKPVFVKVPLVGLSRTRSEPMGSSFVEFVEAIAAGRPLTYQGQPRPDPSKLGQIVWEIHPVILGGSPTDRANRTMLPLGKALEAAAFWNAQMTMAEGNERGQFVGQSDPDRSHAPDTTQRASSGPDAPSDKESQTRGSQNKR